MHDSPPMHRRLRLPYFKTVMTNPAFSFNGITCSTLSPSLLRQSFAVVPHSSSRTPTAHIPTTNRLVNRRLLTILKQRNRTVHSRRLMSDTNVQTVVSLCHAARSISSTTMRLISTSVTLFVRSMRTITISSLAASSPSSSTQAHNSTRLRST